MKVSKLFLLLISIFFFTSIASAKENFDFSSKTVNHHTFKFKTNEPAAFSFLEFLFEEDLNETEDENEQIQAPHFSSNGYGLQETFGSFKFSHCFHFIPVLPKSSEATLGRINSIFLLVQNIRL